MEKMMEKAEDGETMIDSMEKAPMEKMEDAETMIKDTMEKIAPKTDGH